LNISPEGMESKGFDAGERSVSFVFVCFPWVVLLIFQKPIASGYMMSLLLVCLGVLMRILVAVYLGIFWW